MVYKELKFQDDYFLNKYLDCIYIINSVDKSTYFALPRCKIGFTFVLDGKAYIKETNNVIKSNEGLIFGLIQNIQQINCSGNFKEITFGIKLEYMHLFINDSMFEILNGNNTSLKNIYDQNFINEIIEKLYLCNSDYEILNIVKVFLISIVKEHKLQNKIVNALDLIIKNELNNVNLITKELGISDTTLRNIFKEYLGISPKEAIRLERLNKALGYNIKDEEMLLDIAFSLGYYDQSHFINDFKTAFGITPKEYYFSENLISDFYNFKRWNYSNLNLTK
jgi:AraC-like DNA-binding protein